MPRYRKKPVVIDAIKLCDGSSQEEVDKLVGVTGEHIGKFLHGGLKNAKPF